MIAYSIIPISDNGGSSSELIRVFGGPGIGDVRSKYISSAYVALTAFLILSLVFLFLAFEISEVGRR